MKGGEGVDQQHHQPRTMDAAPSVPPSAEAVYAEQFGPLVQLAYLLTFDGHEARDIVQECFAAAIPRWLEIDEHRAYLRRAVTNRSFNTNRDRSRRADKAARHHRESESAPVGSVEYLADAIAALPRKERSIVVLRYYLDLSSAEIAEWLAIPVGSVGPTQARALRRMEKDMEQ